MTINAAKRLAATALATALGAAAVAFAPPSSANRGPFTWCPGDSMSDGVTQFLVWDWNVCHTYYTVGYRLGNIIDNTSGQPSSVWEGDNPPPSPPGCPPIAFLCPPCDGVHC